MNKWLDDSGDERDIVISSRIRLARNVSGIRLPQTLDEFDGNNIVETISESILSKKDYDNFKLHRLKDMEDIERKLFVEKHLISPDLLKKPLISSFLIRDDEKVTIMMNEEDHIRIQVLLSGLNLEQGWYICNDIDDLIEEKIDFAFDEKYGYITSCPTNVGTGLRASVMVHLPCLVLVRSVNKILQAVTQLGLAVRGLYGEGTGSLGNIFQISNQITLGESEEEIISKIKGIVLQIINKEREAREKLLGTKKIELEDKVYRSLGILQNARILDSKETMSLLSDVRMGVGMNIIEGINMTTINNLMIDTQPASVQSMYSDKLSTLERDIKRSEIIREKLRT